MTKEEQLKNLEARVQEVLAFAKEREVSIGAIQKINNEGHIEITPVYRDLKKHD